MMRSLKRKGYRRIVVDGREWCWKCGQDMVIAYTFSGKGDDPEIRKEQAHRVKGLNDPEILARGRYKKTSDGMVTPREVAEWIRRGLSPETPVIDMRRT